MTTRDIVVAGALPRHQVREYLKVMRPVVVWEERTVWSPARVGQGLIMRVPDGTCFAITDATEAQWGQIQEWVRKVTG